MDTQEPFAAAVDKMLSLCKTQYGDAVKAFWFYEAETCPCCTKRQVGTVKYKHEDAVSLNAFMYREMGVLIGYLLCGVCVTDLLRTSKKRQAIMHAHIEQSLIDGYHKHLTSAN